MKGRAVAALSGSLFAVGLGLSGMTNPGTVLGFLDVAGDWDPSLAFVMGGAIAFHLPWLRWVAPRLPSPPAAPPPARTLDARLVGGAAIFGVGWGLSGYCPGPALVAAAYGRLEAVVFAASMIAGVLLFHSLGKRPQPGLDHASSS